MATARILSRPKAFLPCFSSPGKNEKTGRGLRRSVGGEIKFGPPLCSAYFIKGENKSTSSGLLSETRMEEKARRRIGGCDSGAGSDRRENVDGRGRKKSPL